MDDGDGPSESKLNDNDDAIFDAILESFPESDNRNPNEINLFKSANVVTEEQIEEILHPPPKQVRFLTDREFELECQDIEMCDIPKFHPWPPLRKITDDILHDTAAQHQIPPMMPEDEFHARNFGQLNTIGFLLSNGFISWTDYNFIYYKIRFDGVNEKIIPSSYFLVDKELRSITKKVLNFIKSIKEAKLDESPESLFVKFLELCNYSEPYWLLNYIFQDYKNSLLHLKIHNVFLEPTFPINRPYNIDRQNAENGQFENQRQSNKNGTIKVVGRVGNGNNANVNFERSGIRTNNKGRATWSTNNSAPPSTAKSIEDGTTNDFNPNFYSAPPMNYTNNFINDVLLNNVNYGTTNDMVNGFNADFHENEVYFDQTSNQSGIYQPRGLNQSPPPSSYPEDPLLNHQPHPNNLNVSPSFDQYRHTPPIQGPNMNQFYAPPSNYNSAIINDLGLNGNQSFATHLENELYEYDRTSTSAGSQSMIIDFEPNFTTHGGQNGNRINIPAAFLTSQGLEYGLNYNVATNVDNSGGSTTLNDFGTNQTQVNIPDYPPQANCLLELPQPANLQPNFENNADDENVNSEPHQSSNDNNHL